MQQNAMLTAASSLLNMASNPAVVERSRSPPKKAKGGKPNDSDDDDSQHVNSYYSTLGGCGPRGYPLKRRKLICKAMFGKKLNLIAQAAQMNGIHTDRLMLLGTGLGPDTDLHNLKVMTGPSHQDVFDACVNLTSDWREGHHCADPSES